MNFTEIIQRLLSVFDYWIQTDWYIAFLMSLAANVSVYIVAAFIIVFITRIITKENSFAELIDSRALKQGQVRREVINGVLACVVFSLASLLARKLFVGVIPSSMSQLIIEVLVFTIFYETYSYFVHRLLHLKPFRKAHSVHHYSVRTTPWSAYSVHPLEALLISLSAPLFMLIFPVHLVVIFSFHMFGVIFTLVIHSNIRMKSKNVLFRLFNGYTESHSAHHSVGNVNFGFVNSFWDRALKTKLVGSN